VNGGSLAWVSLSFERSPLMWYTNQTKLRRCQFDVEESASEGVLYEVSA